MYISESPVFARKPVSSARNRKIVAPLELGAPSSYPRIRPFFVTQTVRLLLPPNGQESIATKRVEVRSPLNSEDSTELLFGKYDTRNEANQFKYHNPPLHVRGLPIWNPYPRRNPRPPDKADQFEIATHLADSAVFLLSFLFVKNNIL